MKLEHINKSVPASEYSELDFLKAENAFLQDELKLQEMEHSLELYETILDCISKEGKVSKSLELMFGENASSVETFEAELKEQYDATVEGLLDFFRKGVNIAAQTARDATVDRMIQTTKEKIEKIKKADLTKVKYPFDIPGSFGGNKAAALVGSPYEKSLFNRLKDAKTKDDIESALTWRKNQYPTDVKGHNLQKKTIESPDDIDMALSGLAMYHMSEFRSEFTRKIHIQDALDNVLKIIKSKKDPLYVMCFRVLHAEFRATIYAFFKQVNSIYSHVFGNKDSEN